MSSDMIFSYLKAAGDLLLPRTCLTCNRKLLLDERHLCLHCLADMPLTRFWDMSRNPMADRFNALLLEEADRYIHACALFYYDNDGKYRHLPYHIKYQGNIPAGRHFGRMLGGRMASNALWGDVDCIIPVPLHWKRKWKRGYNQAEVIAEGISTALGAPMNTQILKRRRSTATQTKLSIEDKKRNVMGAFEVRCLPESFSFRHVLLVDDIFTTGSTLGACLTALRAVFPPSVRISVATLGFVGHI